MFMEKIHVKAHPSRHRYLCAHGEAVAARRIQKYLSARSSLWVPGMYRLARDTHIIEDAVKLIVLACKGVMLPSEQPFHGRRKKCVVPPAWLRCIRGKHPLAVPLFVVFVASDGNECTPGCAVRACTLSQTRTFGRNRTANPRPGALKLAEHHGLENCVWLVRVVRVTRLTLRIQIQNPTIT